MTWPTTVGSESTNTKHEIGPEPTSKQCLNPLTVHFSYHRIESPWAINVSTRPQTMKSIQCAIALAATALAFSGGAVWSVPVEAPRGFLFTQYRAPLTAEINAVPVCEKTGEASTTYVRDILLTGQTIAWDDASIDEAAREGELSKVYYADHETLEVLGIFGAPLLAAWTIATMPAFTASGRPSKNKTRACPFSRPGLMW